MRAVKPEEPSFWAERAEEYGIDKLAVGEHLDRKGETSQGRAAKAALNYGRFNGKAFSTKTYVDRVRIRRTA